MTTNVLVFDHDPDRLDRIATLIQNHYKEYNIQPLRTNASDKIREFRSKKYDLIVGSLGGTPTAKEALTAYKEEKPRGKAVLYTNKDVLPLEDFKHYKLANGMVRWLEPVEQASDRIELIKAVSSAIQERPVAYWTSPFKSKEFWITLSALLAAGMGLLAAIIKFYTSAAA